MRRQMIGNPLKTALFNAFLILGLTACGGSAGNFDVDPPDTANQPGLDSGQAPVAESLARAELPMPKPRTVAIEDALTELDALPGPEGVEPELFASLKTGLKRMLLQQDESRFSSTAPTGDRNCVTDLAFSHDESGENELVWRYRNVGDYNQDGLVSIHDLTPIGIYFGAKNGDSGWESASVADGNYDGIISISDITPIGQNFLAYISGYVVQSSASGDSPWSSTDTVARPEVYDGDTRQCTVDLTVEEELYYRVVPHDAKAVEGEPSIAISLVISSPALEEGQGGAWGEHWGTYLGEFQGVKCYSNSDVGKPPYNERKWTWGLRYECCEYVCRYTDSKWGFIFIKYKNACDFWYAAANDTRLNRYANGSGEPPRVGDILVWNHSPDEEYGHVAIVSEVPGGPLSQWTWIKVTEQNVTNTSTDVNRIIGLDAGLNIDVSNRWGYPTLGWIRPKNTAPSEPPQPPVDVHVSFGDSDYPNGINIDWKAPLSGPNPTSYNVRRECVTGNDPNGSRTFEDVQVTFVDWWVIPGIQVKYQYYVSSNYPGHEPSAETPSEELGWAYTDAPETYSITGHLTYDGGNVMGHRVVLMPGNIEVTSWSTGNYQFGNLPNSTYSITPDPITGYKWDYPSRNVTISGADRENIDFHASQNTCSVEGRVQRENGEALVGVRMEIDPGNHVAYSFSSSPGEVNWIIPNLTPGNCTLTFSFSGWVFPDSPDSFNLPEGGLQLTPYRGYTPPVAILGADVSSGIAPLTVNFNASNSYDPDSGSSPGDGINIYEFNFDEGAGWQDYGTSTRQHIYSTPGTYSALSRVTDNEGVTTTSQPVTIQVNQPVNQDPIADITATPGSGDAPLDVTLDASDSYDPDGTIVKYEFDFDESAGWQDYGTTDTAEHTYNTEDTYYPKVRVTDNDSATNVAQDMVTVTEGAAWHTYIVDSTGNTGYHTSLCVVDGNPAIAYYKSVDDDLLFVRASNANGTVWGTPQTLDDNGGNMVGQWASLAVINGNPAIAYQEKWPNYDLKYIRATNSIGSTWGAPLVVDTNYSEQGGGISLISLAAAVQSRPAIAYYDGANTTKDLMYLCASDSTGSSWESPITVESDGAVGIYPSMCVVNAYPAISYRDASNQYLKFVRATNSAGSSWDSPVVPDSTNNAGYYTCLRMVNGLPAISYFTALDSSLKYVHATQANGYNWGTPQALDVLTAVGSGTSMAIIGIRPAIAYFDEGNDDLKYISAVDSNGDNWGAAPIVDGSGSVGWDASIAEVNNHPAISYRYITGGDLKYAIYY